MFDAFKNAKYNQMFDAFKNAKYNLCIWFSYNSRISGLYSNINVMKVSTSNPCSIAALNKAEYVEYVV